MKPPEQHEGDAGDVGVTKGSQQEHIPAVLGAEAAKDDGLTSSMKNESPQTVQWPSGLLHRANEITLLLM